MYFQQHISSDHFDCLDCGGCFPFLDPTEKRITWEAHDDNSYPLGIYCDECHHDIMKELNGRNRSEVVSG